MNNLGLKTHLIYIAIISVLAFLYFDKDVTVVDRSIKTIVNTKANPIEIKNVVTAPSIFKVIESDIVIAGDPAKPDDKDIIIPKNTKVYKFKDTITAKIKDSTYNIGTLASTLYAKDSILARQIDYKLYIPEIETIERITKFDNRIMVGAYINFAHTTNTSIMNVAGYTWDSAGIDIMYVRNKMYFGGSLGITQNKYNEGYSRTNITDLQFGLRFGIKPF